MSYFLVIIDLAHSFLNIHHYMDITRASRLVQEEYIAVFYATHEKDTAVG
jgi:hypothetical protein